MIAERLTAANLGQKVSFYLRNPGDPEHPFNEVIGLLQKIEVPAKGEIYHVVRRGGDLVKVLQEDVISLRVVG